MNYEQFKAALAERNITPESHAILTREELAEVEGDWDEEGKASWLEARFDTIEDLLRYDPRASDEDIRRTEEALGVSLPTDYVRFLKEFGGADGLRERWGNVASAHWINGRCDLINEQQDLGLEGQFVRIGDFDSEELGLDTGHFGFLVHDGVCQSQVVWLDHEYGGYEDIRKCSQGLDDVLTFLLKMLNPEVFEDEDYDDE